MEYGQDPFVDFKKGHLRLKCRVLCCATLIKDPDCLSSSSLVIALSGLDRSEISVWTDSGRDVFDSHVHILPLVSQQPPHGFREICGLILKRFDDQSYIRVGVFRIVEYDERCSELFSLDKSQVTCDDTPIREETSEVDELGRPLFMITIV